MTPLALLMEFKNLVMIKFGKAKQEDSSMKPSGEWRSMSKGVLFDKSSSVWLRDRFCFRKRREANYGAYEHKIGFVKVDY